MPSASGRYGLPTEKFLFHINSGVSFDNAECCVLPYI